MPNFIDFKQYIRRGKLDESRQYEGLLRLKPGSPILAILEGRGRRKTRLPGGKALFENYQAPALIGLEDALTGNSLPSAAGVYPGSHYALWDQEDFLNQLQISAELARRSVLELSRRIRMYDRRESTRDLLLSLDPDPGIDPQAPVMDEIYEMSFAQTDEFPAHITGRLGRTLKNGDFLLREGESGRELYIILSGELEVFQNRDGQRKKIDTLVAGQMAGEMGQFDGLPRSADVVASTDVSVLEFDPTNFHFLFQLHPRWSFQLLHTLALRTQSRIAELG
ncbi:MAG: cyclic nucleotide-binding domain-containing protein [Spirochaetales bacterium]|nr:cyclic nucleotide-binding domain-containing protein [Spirochaetales bacterium]